MRRQERKRGAMVREKISGVKLAILQFGFELDTLPALIKWKRSRQDGGSNLYPLQLVNFLERNSKKLGTLILTVHNI